MELKDKINDFSKIELNLVLILDKTKIINVQKESVTFLRYRIHETLTKKCLLKQTKLIY